jgi:hypothetical protein
VGEDEIQAGKHRQCNCENELKHVHIAIKKLNNVGGF